MNEKSMYELRNSKVNEMESIVNNAKNENRVINEEETTKFNDLKKEVEDIDNTIKMNDTVKKMEVKKMVEDKKELSVEDKERKQFENRIRGIVNTDDPTTKTDGQVLIPKTIWDRIIDQVIEISPIFANADRYNVKGQLVLPKFDKKNSSIVMEYADEGTQAESGKVVIGQVTLNDFLGRALAKISKSLINNTDFDIVGFVEAKMAQAIAVFIEHELLKGTEGKIEGLRGIDADMTVTSAAANAITVDELMDTQDKVIDNYQGNAFWIMNRTTRNAIRKLKDKEGDYLLNRDVTSKWGYTLLGKDVYCSDAMDEIGSGKTVIFYGDYTGLAVKVSEEANMQVLNERYAEEHMTGILAFLEMDAKVADTQKISKLVCAA